MTDEITLGLTAIGSVLATKAVDYFWSKFLRRGDDLEKKAEEARVALLTRLDERLGSVEKVLPDLATKERLDKGFDKHNARFEKDHDMLIDHESRLQRREGRQGEGNTSPGYRSAELDALQARHKGGSIE